MTKWLVIDCDGLSYRAYHAMGGIKLSHKQMPTTVTYRFLGDILHLQGQFGTENVAFCFDSRHSKRKEVSKTYKLQRSEKKKEMTKDERKRYEIMCRQRKLLRVRYLKRIGFRNVLHQRGYEADDLIASVCRNLRKKDEAIVVTDDKDMYQLISKRVTVWRPRAKELWTRERFKKVYDIQPSDWVLVKTLAGCFSDEVSGIKGVGEKSVCDYINDRLKGKRYELIIDNMKKMIKQNQKLVDLPFEGCETPKLIKKEEIDWKPVLKSLGIKSLQPQEAGYVRRPLI